MMARIVDKRNLRNMTPHINRRILRGNEKLREGYKTAAESSAAFVPSYEMIVRIH